jgi:menaquinone-dependent protoporphyrinogen IX oxidase
MDKKIAVIYQSHYGTTKKYAEWIAEELGAELLERKKVSVVALDGYDIIVYGGGLYASGILGVDLVTKNHIDHLVVFTVGLANPQTTDYSAIIKKNFPGESCQPDKVFHLRGGIDYKKLNLIHRGLMAMLKNASEKKPETERTEETKEILRTYGGMVDFTDRETISPLVAFVREAAR